MYAESAGNHSAINDNLKDGGARTGKKAGSSLPGKGVPFQAGSEWNNSAANYMASQLGINTSELSSKYGSFVQSNFLDKYSNIKNLSPEKANSYLGGAAKGYEWLDSFANRLGFGTAEELNSKEGAKAMKNYYSGAMQSAPQDSIDFSQPFNLNIVR